MIFKCLPTHQDWRCLNKHEGNFYLQVHRPPYRGSFGIRNVTLKKKPETHPGIFLLTAKNQKNLRFKRFGELKCSDAPVQKPGDVLGEPSITFPGGVSECNAKNLRHQKPTFLWDVFSWLKMGRVTTPKWMDASDPISNKQSKKKTQNAKFPDQERHIGLAFEIRETCFFGQSFSWCCLISTPWKMSGWGGLVKTPLSRKQPGWREISGNSWWFNIENPCNVWQPTKKHISWQVFNKKRVGWKYTPCDSKWPFDSPVGGHDSPFKGSRFHHPAENFWFTSSNLLGKKEIKMSALGGSSQLLVSGSDHPHLQAIERPFGRGSRKPILKGDLWKMGQLITSYSAKGPWN